MGALNYARIKTSLGILKKVARFIAFFHFSGLLIHFYSLPTLTLGYCHYFMLWFCLANDDQDKPQNKSKQQSMEGMYTRFLNEQKSSKPFLLIFGDSK